MTMVAPRKHAHKLVADTAREMAACVYEELMKRNDWYANWQAQNPGADEAQLLECFVRKATPEFLEQARATLAGLLKTNIDEFEKQRIMEALLLDNNLRLAHH